MRVWLMGLVACAGGAGADFDRACDESTIDGDCIEFTGSGWVEEDVSADCDGTIVAECPPNAEGRCTIESGLPFETQTYFYGSFWPGNSASQACTRESNATWTIL